MSMLTMLEQRLIKSWIDFRTLFIKHSATTLVVEQMVGDLEYELLGLRELEQNGKLVLCQGGFSDNVGFEPSQILELHGQPLFTKDV